MASQNVPQLTSVVIFVDNVERHKHVYDKVRFSQELSLLVSCLKEVKPYLNGEDFTCRLEIYNPEFDDWYNVGFGQTIPRERDGYGRNVKMRIWMENNLPMATKAQVPTSGANAFLDTRGGSTNTKVSRSLFPTSLPVEKENLKVGWPMQNDTNVAVGTQDVQAGYNQPVNSSMTPASDALNDSIRTQNVKAQICSQNTGISKAIDPGQRLVPPSLTPTMNSQNSAAGLPNVSKTPTGIINTNKGSSGGSGARPTGRRDMLLSTNVLSSAERSKQAADVVSESGSNQATSLSASGTPSSSVQATVGKSTPGASSQTSKSSFASDCNGSDSEYSDCDSDYSRKEIGLNMVEKRFKIRRWLKNTTLNVRAFRGRNLYEVVEEQAENGGILERSLKKQVSRCALHYLILNCKRPPHATPAEKKLVADWIVKKVPGAGLAEAYFNKTGNGIIQSQMRNYIYNSGYGRETKQRKRDKSASHKPSVDPDSPSPSHGSSTDPKQSAALANTKSPTKDRAEIRQLYKASRKERQKLRDNNDPAIVEVYLKDYLHFRHIPELVDDDFDYLCRVEDLNYDGEFARRFLDDVDGIISFAAKKFGAVDGVRDEIEKLSEDFEARTISAIKLLPLCCNKGGTRAWQSTLQQFFIEDSSVAPDLAVKKLADNKSITQPVLLKSSRSLYFVVVNGRRINVGDQPASALGRLFKIFFLFNLHYPSTLANVFIYLEKRFGFAVKSKAVSLDDFMEALAKTRKRPVRAASHSPQKRTKNPSHAKKDLELPKQRDTPKQVGTPRDNYLYFYIDPENPSLTHPSSGGHHSSAGSSSATQPKPNTPMGEKRGISSIQSLRFDTPDKNELFDTPGKNLFDSPSDEFLGCTPNKEVHNNQYLMRSESQLELHPPAAGCDKGGNTEPNEFEEDLNRGAECLTQRSTRSTSAKAAQAVGEPKEVAKRGRGRPPKVPKQDKHKKYTFDQAINIMHRWSDEGTDESDDSDEQ